MLIKKFARARDFYFDYYHSKTGSFTVQDTYNWHLTDEFDREIYPEFDDLKNKLVNFSANLSNDYKNELILDSILECSPQKIREIIESCFVATDNDPEFKAFVRDHDKFINGKIIFFSLPLSILIHRYAVVLACWVHGQFNESMLSKARELASQLGGLQKIWNAEGQIVLNDLDSRVTDCKTWHHHLPEKVRDFSIFLATQMTGFLLGHEYGHVALGLSDTDDKYGDYFLIHHEDWSQLPGRHRKEMQCDVFSATLNSGSLQNKTLPTDTISIHRDAALGWAFGLVVLGQLVPPTMKSDTHPTVGRRLNQFQSFYREFGLKEDVLILKGMLNGFLAFLVEAQGADVAKWR